MSHEIEAGQSFAEVIASVVKGMAKNRTSSCSVDVDLADMFPNASEKLKGYVVKVTFESSRVKPQE